MKLWQFAAVVLLAASGGMMMTRIATRSEERLSAHRKSTAATEQAQPTTKEAAKQNQPGVFSTPEELVKTYLAAPTWQDRLLCVINPEAVRSQMAATYKNFDPAKNRDTFRPGTVYPVKKRPTTVGERVIVKIDVSESLPHAEYLRYVVVRTHDGFKINWRESLKLYEEDTARATRNALGDATLEVQVLKVYQSSRSHTSLDIRVTNKSKQFIGFWSVGADLHDNTMQYLGHSRTNGSNLRPRQSVTREIICTDIRAADVKSWKLALDTVDLDLGGGTRTDATRYFDLREVR